MDFGSREWQAYHHGRNNGHRYKGDRATRANAALRHAMTKTGERECLDLLAAELDADAQAVAAWDAACEALALDANHEAQQIAAIKSNLTSERAEIVRLVAPLGLPESTTAGLLSAGWRWSPRRGGMWWASRNPQNLQIAAAILA